VPRTTAVFEGMCVGQAHPIQSKSTILPSDFPLENERVFETFEPRKNFIEGDGGL
jgi:hypothetical protein